jgi:hypothetical protein
MFRAVQEELWWHMAETELAAANLSLDSYIGACKNLEGGGGDWRLSRARAAVATWNQLSAEVEGLTADQLRVTMAALRQLAAVQHLDQVDGYLVQILATKHLLSSRQAALGKRIVFRNRERVARQYLELLGVTS